MILFIDDEPSRVASFVENIQDENHEIKNISSLEEADQYLVQHFEDVELIILDIMMPIQNFSYEEHDENGVNGGLLLYKKIRENHQSIPMIIFTNITDENIQKRITNDPSSVFMHKRRTLPFELAYKVNELINSNLSKRSME